MGENNDKRFVIYLPNENSYVAILGGRSGRKSKLVESPALARYFKSEIDAVRAFKGICVEDPPEVSYFNGSVYFYLADIEEYERGEIISCLSYRVGVDRETGPEYNPAEIREHNTFKTKNMKGKDNIAKEEREGQKNGLWNILRNLFNV